MFHAKGYDKRRIILDTPKVVAKSEVKESEKTVLEEPVKANDDRQILTEDVVTEEVQEEPKKKSGRKSKKSEE